MKARDTASSAQKRERRYKHAIPSRDELMAALEQAGRPLTLEALGGQLELRDPPRQKALETRLKAMVRDGQLIRNRAREFCLTRHLDLVTGRVQAHRDGYGFLTPDDGSEDIYLSAREMASVWDGDRIAVRVSVSRRGREGRLVEILERGTSSVVGRLHRERGIDFVVPSGKARPEVLIGRGEQGQAKPGDIVRAEITQHPTARTHALGRVTDIIGQVETPGIEIDVAILSHGLPNEWSAEAEHAAARLPSHVTQAAKRGREDLRSLPLVTIDAADAKDFDDAVYCERDGAGWRLLVAIADVSHYVEPGTALDHDARMRGTSVYFPGRVVPMLPEALSNELCSLKPRVDRLCLCCEMRVSRRGQVTRSRFFEAVMRSAARLTYLESWRLLRDARPSGKHAGLRDRLMPLREAYQALAGARRRRGTIDFDLPEAKLELDERGQVESVQITERVLTHRLIEECMIAANVETAKHLRKGRIPALYRVHEGPDPDRVEELVLFLGTFGMKLAPASRLRPQDISRVIESVAGKPEAELIETVVLRSMKQARYQPKNIGHFGLALPNYSHFTSPIRRYPDLLAHRAIKWLIRKGSAKGFAYSLSEMTQLGEHCSRTERRANEAVWDVEGRLKCHYLKPRVGETFTVLISGVAPFGLFVRIPQVQADGLVHVTSLPKDYYHRDPAGTSLTGERSGTRYRLMDALEAKLVAVDVEEQKIDFVPVQTVDEAPAEAPRGRRRRRRGR